MVGYSLYHKSYKYNKNKYLKRSIKQKHLERITKSEMSYLIKKGILKQFHGSYGENLIVTGKFGSGRGKQRYVTPFVYNYLLREKSKDKNRSVIDIDKIKHNQRYLLSSSDGNGSSNGSVSVS